MSLFQSLLCRSARFAGRRARLVLGETPPLESRTERARARAVRARAARARAVKAKRLRQRLSRPSIPAPDHDISLTRRRLAFRQ